MKKLSRNRPIDINYWCGCVGVPLVWYNNRNWFEVFDKKSNKVLGTYKFLKKTVQHKIDKDKDNERYLFFPQWKHESRYINLMKTINNPKVTEFFQNAKDEEDAYLRYRCFMDWNVLNESEWYESCIIEAQILIKWCQENNIEYVFEIIEKPKDYIYDDPNLSQYDWEIRYDELERIYE